MRALRPALLLALLAAGCREDMHDQPRYEPLERSDFFPDHRASRLPPEGTVARGRLRADLHLELGVVDGLPARTFPFRIESQDLERGRERYRIFCADCHDAAGTGTGIVVRRGFPQPPSYHQERLRNAPPGYFFGIMTGGFGAMPSFASQIRPEDRWRIAAWIRVLQRSRNATLDDLSPEDRARLESGG